MRITLRKYEAGRSYIGTKGPSGSCIQQINHYKVDGFLDHRETSIALCGGRYNRRWRLFKNGGYSGHYTTADEALTALHNFVQD